MSNQERSTSEIERDVEASRARLATTLDRIERKLSPGELIEDTLTYFRNSEAVSGVGEFGRNFARTVRDNPIPVSVVAAGLGWLMWATARPERHGSPMLPAPRQYRRRPYAGAAGPAGDREDGEDRGPAARASAAAGDAAGKIRGKVADVSEAGQEKVQHGVDRVRETAAAARQSAGDALEGARERFDTARERFSETAADARERVLEGAAAAREGAINAGRQARETFRDNLQEHPLAMVAAAFAVGAAIGAVVPRTRQEDEYLGQYRDALVDEVKETAERQLENVGAVAGAAYTAAKDEAEKQGLTAAAGKEAGEKAKEKLGAVAEAAVSASKNKAEETSLTGKSEGAASGKPSDSSGAGTSSASAGAASGGAKANQPEEGKPQPSAAQSKA